MSLPPGLYGTMWSSSVAVMEQPGMPSQHLTLLGIQLFQPVDYAAAHVIFLGLQLWPHASLIGQDIEQGLVAIAADGSIHRGDLFVELEHAVHIVDRAIQREGDVFGGGFMV